MNAGHVNQEKRTIKVKDFLDDFREGLPDEEILKKYYLTPVGLEKFYELLVERGILTYEELEDHYNREAFRKKQAKGTPEKSTLVSPNFSHGEDSVLDTSPYCGNQQTGLDQEDYDQKAARIQQGCDEDDFKRSSNTLDIAGQKNPANVNNFSTKEYKNAPRDLDELDFMGAQDLDRQPPFDDSLDEVVAGMPLDFADEVSPHEKLVCDGCKSEMEEGLRDVYDRKRSYFALMIAGVFLLFGLVGITGINFFETYTFARLLVAYMTGLFLLLGAALLTVGCFMFLARERVYACLSCGRVYRRL